MDDLKSLYIDMPSWNQAIKIDDFIVAVGVKRSNSVYHVAKVKPKPQKNKRVIRYYMKVFKCDLLTALKRDPEQSLFTVKWYSRNKK